MKIKVINEKHLKSCSCTVCNGTINLSGIPKENEYNVLISGLCPECLGAHRNLDLLLELKNKYRNYMGFLPVDLDKWIRASSN